jgi:hypothetical protein
MVKYIFKKIMKNINPRGTVYKCLLIHAIIFSTIINNIRAHLKACKLYSYSRIQYLLCIT